LADGGIVKHVSPPARTTALSPDDLSAARTGAVKKSARNKTDNGKQRGIH
jgi:hypothetical protein